jgi:hypothetical protein
MGSSKTKPVDRAVPLLRKPKQTDAMKVATTTATVTAMQGSSLWNSNPALQASANAWSAASTAISTNAALIADLRSKLAVALADQRSNRRNWTDALKHTLATVSTLTQGSSDAVHGLGFDVRTHITPGSSTTTPAGLAALPSKVVGEAIIHWVRGGAKHGFLVQHATDVANAATFSAVIACTKTKFKLDGLASGSTVHFRVAAIDPSVPVGQSPWSDWVAAQAR